MKKIAIVVLALLLVGIFAVQVLAQYDRDLVVKTMQSNRAVLGEVTKAAKENNFFVAAEKLMDIAKNFKGLDAVTPTKGKKEDWDRIHGAIIKTAFKGIGACGEEDAEKLNAAIAEINGFLKEGHGMFR